MRNFFGVNNKMPRGFYSIVLDAASQLQLRQFWHTQPPEVRTTYNKLLMHHMTMAFNPDAAWVERIKPFLGHEVELTVTHTGKNEKAFAIKVTSDDNAFMTMNKHPHITIATRENVQPVESNSIESWVSVPIDKQSFSFSKLRGTVIWKSFQSFQLGHLLL